MTYSLILVLIIAFIAIIYILLYLPVSDPIIIPPPPCPEPPPVPSPEPTPVPSPEPTPVPSPEPTPLPSPEPSPEPTPMPSPEPTPPSSPDPDADYHFDLDMFEHYYKTSFTQQYSMRHAQVQITTLPQFSHNCSAPLYANDFRTANGFITFCEIMLQYCYRYMTETDSLYQSVEVSQLLLNCLMCLHQHLPTDPTSAPWGDDVFVFGQNMNEMLMTVACILKGTIHYTFAREMARQFISIYTPYPDQIINTITSTHISVTLAIPYIYSQMLNQRSLRSIRQDRNMERILSYISCNPNDPNSAMSVDNIFIFNNVLRNNRYITHTFYMLKYFQALFGENAVNMTSVNECIAKTISPEGQTNILFTQNFDTRNLLTLRLPINYTLGVKASEYCGVLSNLTNDYFSCIVGAVPGLAVASKIEFVQQAENITYPLPAIMNRTLFNRNHTYITSHIQSAATQSGMFILESNAMIDEQVMMPNNNSTVTMVHFDTIGAMMTLTNLPYFNLSYRSCTVLHPTGLVQFYTHVSATGVSVIPLIIAVRRYHNIAWEVQNDERITYEGIIARPIDLVNYVRPAVRMHETSNHVLVAVLDIPSDGRLYGYTHTVQHLNNTSVVSVRAIDAESFECIHVKLTYTDGNAYDIIFYYPYLFIKTDQYFSISNSSLQHIHLPEGIITQLLNVLDIDTAYEPLNCLYDPPSGFIHPFDATELQFRFRFVTS
ncbi:odv-e66 [Spodoptera litura granulovirus]|uniref:Odv-e66 n=1 Tax=Spodoptera litura granulovirus TaxID=359919 RepID=A5IZX7_9BBAC|nr:odv-e66 [Spodoptera litura granulovirus]ABQ52068.1 odv-e66 [Spodoptera litura granulovirus]